MEQVVFMSRETTGLTHYTTPDTVLAANLRYAVAADWTC